MLLNKGFWMWSKPINLKTKNSEKEVSILLMDSQGQFDNLTSNRESACIFSISAFMR